MEFHIARSIRDRYQFQHELFSTSGNVIFANFYAVRLFVQKINDEIDLIKFPERAVRAGQINAMGLIDEILHFVVKLYRDQTGTDPFEDIVRRLQTKLGESFDRTLLRFIREFPPRDVYAGAQEPEAYLAGASDGSSHRAAALEELMLLWLANANPAFSPYRELFDEVTLRDTTAYADVIAEIQAYFRDAPPFGPDAQPLTDMLRSPAIAVPHSLSGQLRYMRERWGVLLGKYLYQLLSSLDLLKEEEKLSFGGGPGPTQAYTYSSLTVEHEGFSPDREWMPKVVLMAKSTFVWLDQLSKKYRRPIDRLDQIPDEVLDELRDRGFTGLWLIGLWERSHASKRIKQMTGSPDAEASAYSISSYNVAGALGGWEALQNLRDRCWYRGIRLASDMVPNHTGIDSEWIANRPERFVQVPYPPFPSYTYNGENLSATAGVGIYLEDHYFDRTDAAVTFKRVDFSSGEARYIYHGNDGTHMPWNDTAQLNFLDPAVREAVIQTILHVAHNFPIIRFDAAMTLARQHVQRLWYPEPGSGGDIPSRTEHGMTREAFARAMPVEFWREVVDRVAAELPDTLLLAEAFWMMEGFFVRTLGMHRVYNSAFMNMLKEEENAKYRTTIKNTLEFDPEILKRFVNFMNNPDEETAVRQFGDGDKYFGVCTMMVTMPGLPMFGHGQIEGLAEKYGMEYRRAKWEESENRAMIERHGREIFPLMKRRYLFAEAANFRLYDLYTADGSVNENVFAYSNRSSDEHTLIFYNNRYDRASGWINMSCAYSVKDGASRTLVRSRLGEELGLVRGSRRFTTFREQRSGLWFIRSSDDVIDNGFYVELGGYQTQIFEDFRQMEDNDLGHYRRLADKLSGRGVADIDSGLKEIFVEPILDAFGRAVNEGALRAALSGPDFAADMVPAMREFLRRGCDFSGIALPENALSGFADRVDSVRAFLGASAAEDATEEFRSYVDYGSQLNASAPAVLMLAAMLEPIGVLLPGDSLHGTRSLIDQWLLAGSLRGTLRAFGAAETEVGRDIEIIRICASHFCWYTDIMSGTSVSARVGAMIEDEAVRVWLGENRYEDRLWFNREAYLELVWWLFAVAEVELRTRARSGADPAGARISLFATVRGLLDALDHSQYQVESLLTALSALDEH